MFKDLDSWDFKYAEKDLGPTKSWSVEVDKKRSKSECKHKTSFGITGSKLWVKKGCRATFKICHYPESGELGLEIYFFDIFLCFCVLFYIRA